jgi:group I intron endonuclease
MDKQQRKQLIQNYKQTHRPMGIYQLKNQINGKLLIGSSMNLDAAFNRETFMLSMNSHINRELQEDWNQYGKDAFTFDILERIKPREEIITHPDELEKYQTELKEMEEKWLQKLQPYGDRGYNKLKKAKNAR